MKKFLFVLLMLVCVAAAVLFVFLEKLDGIVQAQIEKVGTETLGQPVTVEGVDIELKNGMGQITGLRIANPEGFADAYAFDMQKIRLAIAISSISKDPLVLNEFVLEEPVTSLEIRGDGSSNLDAIIAHLRARKKAEEKEPAKEPSAEPSDEDAPPPAMVIRSLKISGVQLILRHPKLGEDPLDLVLPEIVLRDLGGEEGLTPTGISLAVVEEIAKEGAKAAVKAEAEKQAGRLLDKAGASLLKKRAPAENAP